MNFKQIIGAFLFLIFTTTVVDAHALSHLFDGDSVSVQDCNSCDEFTLATKESLYYFSTEVFELNDFYLLNVKIDFPINYVPQTKFKLLFGQYYNKPPPFKLV